MTITAKYPGRCRRCGGAIAVGDHIEWGKETGASHASCPEKSARAEDPNIVRISGGSGYGCSGWAAGQFVRHMARRRRAEGEVLQGEDPETVNRYWVDLGWQYLVVISSGKKYVREDGMSFGVGGESGYVYSANCRLATDAEIGEHVNGLIPEATWKNARFDVDKIAGTIQQIGERPTDEQPEGQRILDTQDVYGGGDWFMVGNDYIWYVCNNGMDGEDWSVNNVRTGGAGAIGWRIPYDKGIYTRLVECDALMGKK